MAPKERGAIQIKLHVNLYTYSIYYATYAQLYRFRICRLGRGARHALSLIHIFRLSVDFFSMANDNSRKFKQNQIIFCLQP